MDGCADTVLSHEEAGDQGGVDPRPVEAGVDEIGSHRGERHLERKLDGLGFLRCSFAWTRGLQCRRRSTRNVRRRRVAQVNHAVSYVFHVAKQRQHERGCCARCARFTRLVFCNREPMKRHVRYTDESSLCLQADLARPSQNGVDLGAAIRLRLSRKLAEKEIEKFNLPKERCAYRGGGSRACIRVGLQFVDPGTLESLKAELGSRVVDAAEILASCLQAISDAVPENLGWSAADRCI